MLTALIASATDYSGFVDPRIGTGGHGHVFIGANVPGGMVQLGPSQPVRGWDWTSGYHHSDDTIVGFSHTHLSGTGVGDLGDITFFPTSKPSVRKSSFSHKKEKASPGYYSVRLDDAGVEAELTATNRVGCHRYRNISGGDTLYLRVDLNYGVGWDGILGTQIKPLNDSTIVGYRFSKGWARDQKIYFTASFSKPFVSCNGDSAVSVLAFPIKGEPLDVKVGISPVSVQNSGLNLSAETLNLDFDKIRNKAAGEWNDKLSKIRIETADETKKRVFYTSMYHLYYAPVTFCDVNGDYRGADGRIYNTGGEFTNYSIFSLWDTYRAAHPLLTLISPEVQKDYVNTFINIWRQQGKLPVWHLWGNETDCMVGNPGVIVLADLYLKGFVPDTTAAYEAMKTSMLMKERSLASFNKYGYIPFDAADASESVAKGMEYAIAADALSRVAQRAGYNEDAVYFGNLGKAYRRYFDPETGFMRALSIDGKRRDEVYNPFVASHRVDDYTEGNGWQYLWLVPQDVHDLVSLLGKEKFGNRLDSLFVVEGDLGDDASPDISGLIGQYAHGNEPSHHIIYLYDYIGKPYKAAPLLRKIMNELYHDTPDGLSGNEDVGQMSAWYILSSLGLYQVNPAGGRYLFGSPLFDSATVDVGGGKKFNIIAHNNSDRNIYIQKVLLNGRPYPKSYIDFPEIVNGGTLEFYMGPEPSSTFAVDEVDCP